MITIVCCNVIVKYIVSYKNYMKVFLFAFMLIFGGAILNACEKSGSDVITGRWNVINDSSIITGPSISYDVFRGSDDDYFNFSSGGSLYIKESSVYDTINYQIISPDTLLLPGIGFSINGITAPSIFTIKDGRLRIIVNPPGNIITPGHQYQRIINLKR